MRDLRIARDLGVAPRRLWGWEPATVHEYDGTGRLVKSVTEPEWDKRQYEYMAALHEHEATIGDHGQPLDESMSPLADPFNPEGTHTYVARPIRDWADAAIEEEQQKPQWSGENFSRARKWRVFKVER